MQVLPLSIIRVSATATDNNADPGSISSQFCNYNQSIDPVAIRQSSEQHYKTGVVSQIYTLYFNSNAIHSLDQLELQYLLHNNFTLNFGPTDSPTSVLAKIVAPITVVISGDERMCIVSFIVVEKTNIKWWQRILCLFID